MTSYSKKIKDEWKWFVHNRFGMFIHWGLYALPARHEWVKSRECISDEEYQRYFDHFNPDLYDAKVWAKAAKNAGMRYFVITTKHPKASVSGIRNTPTTKLPIPHTARIY